MLAAAMGQRQARRASEDTRFESASSFVGREAILGAIEARFDDGARLVTLLAPGGMGKTRVAARFASSAREAFVGHGGGVFFVDLEATKDLPGFIRALAAALGETLERSRDPALVARSLGRALARRKRVLVVLDGFESIARQAASTLRAFTEAAPAARWLVTSRLALGLPGEHLIPLDPLETPPPGAGDAEVLASPAVELFVRRARGVRPELALGPGDLATAAAIVRRTDGIPLAIELAAARLAVLSLAQIAERLSAPLDLLVARKAEGRHASMRRAVHDSIEPLGPGERLALARASVFRGGFTVEAAEAILVDDPAQALGALEALVAASLVRTREVRGASRFTLLDVVRELASEELSADAAGPQRTRARHAAFYAALARDLGDPSRAGPRAEALARLSDELDNLMVAHAHEVGAASKGEAGAAERAIELALGAGAVLSPRGAIALYLDLIERALDAPGTAPPRLRARAELARGVARRELGDVEGARAALDHGLASARSLGDPALESHALARLGEIVETSGQTAEAKALFVAAIERLDQAEPGRARRALEADARARLAHALRREGALDQAEREIHRALAIHRDDGDPTPLPAVLYEAAVIALIAERSDEALARFDEALALARLAGARHDEAALASARGILLQEAGRLDEALASHAEAARIFREVESRHREGSALYYFGAALLERGSPDDALKVLDRSSERMSAVGMPRYDALIAGARSVAEAHLGRVASADGCLALAARAADACATEPTIGAGVQIHRMHVDLLLGRRSDRDACVQQAHALRLRASNDDVRFALRLIERFGHAPQGSPALRVERTGASFEFLGARVDLSRRAPLRRILLVLAQAHIERSGEALSLDEVVRAGWPGERIGSASAANRVRVALATLRKLGLKRAIVTVQGGYALDAALTVVLDPD